VQVFKIHNGLDHRQLVGVENSLLPGDIENGFKFLLGEGFARGAEEGGEAAAGQLEQKAEGGEQTVAEPKGGPIQADQGGGIAQAEIFWAQLAKENQEQGDGRNRDELTVVGGPLVGDDISDIGQGDVDQRVADQNG